MDAGAELGGGGARRGDPATLGALSLEDLAGILDANGELNVETHARLARVVRHHPEVAPKVVALETFARDSNMAMFAIAVMLNQRFDRLLEIEQWEDPAAALGLEDLEEFFYPALIHIAEARAARSDDPGRMLEIKERLVAAEVRELDEAADRMVARLAEMSSEGAERVMVDVRGRVASERDRWVAS